MREFKDAGACIGSDTDKNESALMSPNRLANIGASEGYGVDIVTSRILSWHFLIPCVFIRYFPTACLIGFAVR